ncbi:hypothetical protein FHY09_001466 [Xanthomonas sp. 60]
MKGLLAATGGERTRSISISSIGPALEKALTFPIPPVELPLYPVVVGLVINGAVVQQIGTFVERFAHQQLHGDFAALPAGHT